MQGFLRGGARDVKARRVKGLRAVRWWGRRCGACPARPADHLFV